MFYLGKITPVIQLLTFLVATVQVTFVVGASSCLSITLLPEPVNFWRSAFIFPFFYIQLQIWHLGMASQRSRMPAINTQHDSKQKSVQVHIQKAAIMLDTTEKHLV